MNKGYSIFNSPFSDETKKLRLNSMLASGLCLFIGSTGQLPEKFGLLGVSFTSTQQNTLGWFILSVSLYLFLHFASLAIVDIARWIEPFLIEVSTRRTLLKHPAFDATDFMDITGPMDEQDKSKIIASVKEESRWKIQGSLKYLYNFVYLKIAIEILPPFIIGIWGFFALVQLITRH